MIRTMLERTPIIAADSLRLSPVSYLVLGLIGLRGVSQRLRLSTCGGGTLRSPR